MSDNLNDILLVGAGYMAREYAKVLTGMGRTFQVVGRGEESAKTFEKETKQAVFRGGIDNYIRTSKGNVPEYCIIAVRIEQLADTCCTLLRNGAKKILLEKPGALNLEDMQMMAELAKKNGAEVSIAYNRRFYASTRAARTLIEKDGGLLSFQFEFTEWLHVFPGLKKTKEWIKYVFLGNSTHVMDMAFFLGGKPKEISCYSKTDNDNPECITSFAGAGRTEEGKIFSYCANWDAPGRWGVELMTSKHRLIFRPLEKLQVQQLKSVKIEEAKVDYTLDDTYKPGLYLEAKAFLEHNEDFADLCSLNEQINNLAIYDKIM